MSLANALAYVAGLFFLLLAVQTLSSPLQMAVRVVANSVIGGLALWVINLVGGLVGFHLALNPVSAIVAGVLGVPGVVGLGVARLILG